MGKERTSKQESEASITPNSTPISKTPIVQQSPQKPRFSVVKMSGGSRMIVDSSNNREVDIFGKIWKSGTKGVEAFGCRPCSDLNGKDVVAKVDKNEKTEKTEKNDNSLESDSTKADRELPQCAKCVQAKAYIRELEFDLERNKLQVKQLHSEKDELIAALGAYGGSMLLVSTLYNKEKKN